MATKTKSSIKSFALKWYFFNCPSSATLYAEYFSLFMKQLGFNPAQIGLTSLLGIPQLFLPLYLLFGEKLRARKIAVFFGTLVLTLCCMLPLLALIVPALHPACYTTTSTNSVKAKQQALHTNDSVHSRYAKTLNNISASKRTLSELRSTMMPILKNVPLYPASHHSRNIIRPTRSQTHFTIQYLKSTEPLGRISNSSVYAKSSKERRQKTVPKFPETLKQPSASKTQYSPYLTTNSSLNIQQSVLRNSSLLSNYSNSLTKIHHPQPLVSGLFFILTLSRLLTMYFNRANLALVNLATITYLKEERASYGAYFLWTNIGCTFSISFVALLAWFIKMSICGVQMPGYFIAFLCGGVMSLLSMLSLPWFKFEYNERKSFNWSGVKSDVFNAHYIFMFAVLFYTSLCSSFQIYWEFWYLDKLSPLLLGGVVLIRRPSVALSTIVSSYLIRKIGDLMTVCVSLFLYGSSFLALSFTRIAWLVLVIDTFQAAANVIGYCAFTVLFYKASCKENSSMILGLQETVYSVGFDVGSTLMGVLFHALGTQLTLIIYSMSTTILLASLLLYIRFSDYDCDYQKLTQDDND